MKKSVFLPSVLAVLFGVIASQGVLADESGTDVSRDTHHLVGIGLSAQGGAAAGGSATMDGQGVGLGTGGMLTSRDKSGASYVVGQVAGTLAGFGVSSMAEVGSSKRLFSIGKVEVQTGAALTGVAMAGQLEEECIPNGY